MAVVSSDFAVFSEAVVARDASQASRCFEAARNVGACWGIGDKDLCALTRIPVQEIEQWRQDETAISWDRDQLERTSVLVSINQILQQLLGDSAGVSHWLRFPQPTSPFNGLSPLGKMLNGAMIDLYDVLHWLKCRTELQVP